MTRVPGPATGETGAADGATEAAQWAIAAARAADDKLASETVVIDVGDVLAITEHFVITSGANPRQVKAVVEEVEEQLTAAGGPKPVRIEGVDQLEWVLMDYGTFVVHVFHVETRAYYQLERLWADCPRVSWE